jgi:hypothetical protein
LEIDHNKADRILTSTLAQCIRNGNEGWRWVVERFAVVDGGQTLADAICQGQAIAVSDGSYKDKFGTVAYVLEGATAVNQIMGVLAVPGVPEDQSLYHSELAGLYGIAMMVQVICKYFGITSGGIKVGCDGQIALQRVIGEGPKLNPDIKDADYDLLSTRKLLA